MTRSSFVPNLFALDPEIEQTFRLRRRHCHSIDSIPVTVGSNSLGGSTYIDLSLPAVNIPIDNFVDFPVNKNLNMDANRAERTLKELAAPDVTYQPLCIQYPALNADFELKSGLIHLLPRFHGLTDPHRHLQEFHVVCSTMKPRDIHEDYIKLRAFPFSLDGVAKDWLYYLPAGSVTTWNDLKRQFLEKFSLHLEQQLLEKTFVGLDK
ncbi:hypothetical protein L6164_028535 [Bauhinia variegata]|uniref:Uncharacterized protein n=1 Tax=Bauhinia variegata TaxID=167791 RepID=A0ACB9L6K3_BAUVA|nr:hypothetical protein L6164_028535 [Bauhinia variegata]